MALSLHIHPERNTIRLQLKQNILLADLDEGMLTELADLVSVDDRHRGDFLLRQGDRELRQYFVLDGLLKRIVASTEGRELTLRFAAERDMETSYEAWQLGTSSPYSVVCVTKARVASLSMKEWSDFLGRRPRALRVFEDCVTRMTSAMMGHAIALHLLDAPGRVHDFSCRYPQLTDRLPQKELASHLNLAAETLCRLVRRPKSAATPTFA
jgi:CRP-like cAMP-binding protein